jgi:hypothetical protein
VQPIPPAKNQVQQAIAARAGAPPRNGRSAALARQSHQELWQDQRSGEVWAVELRRGRVVGAAGPLAWHEQRTEWLGLYQIHHGARDGALTRLARERGQFNRLARTGADTFARVEIWCYRPTLRFWAVEVTYGIVTGCCELASFDALRGVTREMLFAGYRDGTARWVQTQVAAFERMRGWLEVRP